RLTALTRSPHRISAGLRPPLGNWPNGHGIGASESPTMRTLPRRAQLRASPTRNLGVLYLPSSFGGASGMASGRGRDTRRLLDRADPHRVLREDDPADPAPCRPGLQPDQPLPVAVNREAIVGQHADEMKDLVVVGRPYRPHPAVAGVCLRERPAATPHDTQHADRAGDFRARPLIVEAATGSFLSPTGAGPTRTTRQARALAL